MRRVVVGSNGVRYGINRPFVEKVIDLRERGVSVRRICGLVDLPPKWVSKIIRTNWRVK